MMSLLQLRITGSYRSRPVTVVNFNAYELSKITMTRPPSGRSSAPLTTSRASSEKPDSCRYSSRTAPGRARPRGRCRRDCPPRRRPLPRLRRRRQRHRRPARCPERCCCRSRSPPACPAPSPRATHPRDRRRATAPIRRARSLSAFPPRGRGSEAPSSRAEVPTSEPGGGSGRAAA